MAITMTQVIHQYQLRSSLAGVATATAAELTDEEIKERHLKYIAEITEDLAPPRSDKLNREQRQWLKRRMRSSVAEPWKSWSKRRSNI